MFKIFKRKPKAKTQSQLRREYYLECTRRYNEMAARMDADNKK